MPTFREKVYAIVAKVPQGKTMTYKEVARRAGSPNAYRVVGNIMNKNLAPIPKVADRKKSAGFAAVSGYEDPIFSLRGLRFSRLTWVRQENREPSGGRHIPRGKIGSLARKLPANPAGPLSRWALDTKKVPCHRVVRSDGDPGGYANGRKAKIAILKREGAIK